jgi:P-type Ca2+ transporter type 2C
MKTESLKELARDAHLLDSEIVVKRLGVAVDSGLTGQEVARRRELHGWNRMETVQGRPAWRIFLAQFSSLVVGLLGAAAFIAWVTGGRVESLAILTVLMINSLVGFLTEWQAGRALEALRRQAKSVARVRREGSEQAIDAEELVAGDIVVLNPGDRIPADLRVVEAISLRMEESALTGESRAVSKSDAAVSAESLLADRHSMLYLGTAVAAGRAIGIVTATGMETELGRIGKLVAETSDEATPLKVRLDELGRNLVYLVLGIGVTVVFTGWWRGESLLLMLETGISLAVAAVPEGLPAVTTLILALGVLRMARANAIVRHLPAVETLGSATVICTDKTGTLTENRMVVREYRLADGRVISGDNSEAMREVAPDPLLRSVVETGVLCNEASISSGSVPVDVGAGSGSPSEWIGDPTETALLEVARQRGIDITALRASNKKIVEEPFDTTTRRMITVHRSVAGDYRACLKGAPSVVLAMCSKTAEDLPLNESTRQELLVENDEMAAGALRVLALAEKRSADVISDLETGYTFLGMVGLLDPPRREAAAAIRDAYAAGIRVVMLTGDQLNTARAIARELGIEECGRLEARHARDLQNVTGDDLARLAGSVQVFARVSPEDKLRIVEALQQSGEVVAVTGDGVNDAPALKRADIGVAMGQRGTETAKEAADIVLTDDNFATIIRAVEGGRTIYANIIKFVQLMLSENLAEVIFIFASILIGWPLPLLPLQILWVNLLTDIFPALALAVEPPSPDIMKNPPRSARESMLSSRFFVLIFWQGAMLALICLAIYDWALRTYGPGEHARTIALFTLIGVQIGHLFNCRSRTRSAFDGIFRNRYLWLSILMVLGLQITAIYLRPLASVLQTVRIGLIDLTVVLGSIFIPIVIVEVVKIFGRIRKLKSGSGRPELKQQ